jgi:hypothetical protein
VIGRTGFSMGEIECPAPCFIRALDLPCKWDLIRGRVFSVKNPSGRISYYCSHLRCIFPNVDFSVVELARRQGKAWKRSYCRYYVPDGEYGSPEYCKLAAKALNEWLEFCRRSERGDL